MEIADRKAILQSKYPFEYVTCYIAKRYDNLQDWQVANQEAALRFMDGKLTEKDKKDILSAVKRTLAKYRRKKGEWVVSFIPASTNERYIKRYRELTTYLRTNLEIPVAYFGVCIRKEGTKFSSSSEIIVEDNLYVKRHLFRVKDRNIILIDDNITTGRTLRTVGDFLMSEGANRICGVIYAMTIHPDLPVKQ